MARSPMLGLWVPEHNSASMLSLRSGHCQSNLGSGELLGSLATIATVNQPLSLAGLKRGATRAANATDIAAFWIVLILAHCLLPFIEISRIYD